MKMLVIMQLKDCNFNLGLCLFGEIPKNLNELTT